MKTMKRRIISLAAAGLMMAGTVSCQEAKDLGKEVSETVKDRKQKIETSRQATESADLAALKSSIAAFHTAEGRYPKDLDELESFSGITIDKASYSYDPAKGTLALK